MPRHISVTSKSDEPKRFFFSVDAGAMLAAEIVRIGVAEGNRDIQVDADVVLKPNRDPNVEIREGAKVAGNVMRFIPDREIEMEAEN